MSEGIYLPDDAFCVRHRQALPRELHGLGGHVVLTVTAFQAMASEPRIVKRAGEHADVATLQLLISEAAPFCCFLTPAEWQLCIGWAQKVRRERKPVEHEAWFARLEHHRKITFVMEALQMEAETPIYILTLARIAHEANRAYCVALGDASQVPWEQAPKWQQDSAIAGVTRALEGALPEDMHASWSAQKIADGWVHGPVKDEAAKTHPCLVPYGELPEAQRVKDRLFLAVVQASSGVLDVLKPATGDAAQP